MFEFDAYRLELEHMVEDTKLLREALHIERALEEASELENRAQEPGFWDDIEKAQQVQQRISRLKERVARYDSIEGRREDLLILCELGAEAEDLSVATEVADGLKALRTDFENLRLETLFTGQYDRNNAILSLHAGAGGTEAQDWVEMLYRMYSRWAERKGFTVKVTDVLEGDEAGLKSATFLVQGENAYGNLRSEKGVHRLVRISPFDGSGRRHTSFASLEVMPELDDTIKIDIRSEDLRIDTYRSSGAGGQHINKTESAIRITHIPTGCVVTCQTERSQVQNKETAMNMLRSKLYALAMEAHLEKIEDLKGIQMEIAWGSQIRSYVFMPYTMVKDHRTGYETGDVQSVMDGDLDGFIQAFLSGMKAEK